MVSAGHRDYRQPRARGRAVRVLLVRVAGAVLYPRVRHATVMSQPCDDIRHVSAQGLSTIAFQVVLIVTWCAVLQLLEVLSVHAVATRKGPLP